MNTTSRLLTACPEYEERLLDAVVDGLDVETAAHLRDCARCAAVASNFVATADVARVALRASPIAAASDRPSRLARWTTRAAGIASAAVLLLLARAAMLSESQPQVLLALSPMVIPQDGAIVEQQGDRTAMIRSGEATFVLADAGSIVQTPFGSLRCPTGGCEFTVSIDEDVCGAQLPPAIDPAALAADNQASVRVAIAVAMGEVESRLNGRTVILSPGHHLNFPRDHN